MTIHESWQPFFTCHAAEIEEILSAVRADGFTPEEARIFRFAQTDLFRLQVVILGQDPYPQPGAATGRSFEVAGLHSWLTPFRQASLRNFVRAIYRAETGETLPWKAVQEKIRDGSFPILPPDRLWDSLEAQGVLFLNTYLTCRPGAPLSHKKLWEPFARALISYLDETRGESLSWFLWGSDARRFGAYCPKGVHYESRHPMMTGPWEDDFLWNPCFQMTKKQVNWLGKNDENMDFSK